MDELSSYFFHMLRLAKVVHDHPTLKRSWPKFDGIALDEDALYELSWETATSVFQDTSTYYNDEEGMETWVLSYPVVDRFCELCIRLETEKGLEEEINPYRRNAEQMIQDSFCISYCGYDYDWRLSAEHRGNWCVLFYTNEEFYVADELPGAFIEILEGFQELNRQLEAELGLNKIIPLYPFMNEWREAA